MLRVGLTGGLACGKSVVGKMLAERGAHLIQADNLAHELMRPGTPVFEQVVQRFGREVVQADGALDRSKLAEAAFGQNRVLELNEIVHPAVIRRQNELMDEIGAREPHAIAVLEAALILEAGISGNFDKLVVVTCAPEQKIDRYTRRAMQADPSLTLWRAVQDAERRMAAQLPDEKKVAAADFVIDNSGSLEQTEQQVEAVMAQLKKLAAESKPGAASGTI